MPKKIDPETETYAKRLLDQSSRYFAATAEAEKQWKIYVGLVQERRKGRSVALRDLSDESLGRVSTRKSDPPIRMKRQPSKPATIIIEYAKGHEVFSFEELKKDIPNLNGKNLRVKLNRLQKHKVLIPVGDGFRLNRNITASDGAN